jgi:hypothetical protein
MGSKELKQDNLWQTILDEALTRNTFKDDEAIKITSLKTDIMVSNIMSSGAELKKQYRCEIFIQILRILVRAIGITLGIVILSVDHPSC